jgi:molybdopterin synthase sulfur carrier subunit
MLSKSVSARVKFFAYFRELFATKEKELPVDTGTTVRDALAFVCDSEERRSEIFDGDTLKTHIVIMKNGASIQSLQGLETPLGDGDILSIFPLMGGG